MEVTGGLWEKCFIRGQMGWLATFTVKQIAPLGLPDVLYVLAAVQETSHEHKDISQALKTVAPKAKESHICASLGQKDCFFSLVFRIHKCHIWPKAISH